MQNQHVFSRATITALSALVALIAAAAASAAVSVDPAPAHQIDWQAINDAAQQQVWFN